MKGQIIERKFLVLAAAIASVGYVFSIATGSIGLMLFLLAWLVNFRNINIGAVLKKNSLYLLALFFIVLIIQLSYSLNMKQGQKDIMRFLSFILFPLIFLTIKPFEKNERILIIRIFVHALSIFFVFCFITAIVRQIGFWNRGGIFNWYYFYRYDFLEIFRQHPTYLSMFTLLSLSFILNKKNEVIKQSWLMYGSVLLQIGAIFLYGSRIGYLLFLLLAGVYIFKKISSESGKARIKKFLVYTSGLILLVVIMWNIPIIKERLLFSMGLDYDYKFNNKEFIGTDTPEEKGRLLLWQDALDVIKEKPLIGYGTGSARDVLLKKYQIENHQLFLEKRYNAHNSYLELLIMGGLVLLASYLSILVVLLYNSHKRKDVILLSYFLIIFVTSITETIFRAEGVLFLSFFYCFLLTKPSE
jgi:O-antigen ligase